MADTETFERLVDACQYTQFKEELNDTPWFQGLSPKQLTDLKQHNPDTTQPVERPKTPTTEQLRRLEAYMPRQRWALAFNTFLDPVLEGRTLSRKEISDAFFQILPPDRGLAVELNGGYTAAWLRIFSSDLFESLRFPFNTPSDQINEDIAMARAGLKRVGVLGIKGPDLIKAFHRTFRLGGA